MAISLKHKFTLAKADGTDNTVVQPSDWNDDHVITAASGKVLGTRTDSTTVTELPIAVDSSGNVSLGAGLAVGGNATVTGNLTITGTISGGVPSSIPAGTRMLFQQTAAPTGWTKDTNPGLNHGLRVTGGTASTGGSLPFTSVFASRAVSGSTSSEATTGTVHDHTLTIEQIPSHTHSYTTPRNTGGASQTGSSSPLSSTTSGTTGAEGGGLPHSHGFTGSTHAHTFSGAVDMSVQYVDVIIAVKN